MVEGGLHPAEVYLTDAEIGDTMFAMDYSGLHDFLGRPRRAWWGFADHAHTQKVQIGREYGCFTAQHGMDAVIQVVKGVRLTDVLAAYDLSNIIEVITATPESDPQAAASAIPPTPPDAPTATSPAAWLPADIPW